MPTAVPTRPAKIEGETAAAMTPIRTGKHWWISPRTRLAGVLMTQRAFGFWHPCAFECKRLMYEAVGATRATPA